MVEPTKPIGDTVERAPSADPTTDRIHRWLTIGIQAVILLGLILEIVQQQWLNAVLVLGILLLTVVPQVLTRQVRLFVPPEFELLAIAFIFASLFLGERQDYYGRFWWWDLALHATSGGLMGTLGFLLVYVLNQNPRVELHMRAGFVAFFAFCFSMAVGALWEIFEFSMDQLFATNMQKPMFGDPSGLTDTMWDLILDAVGTLAVCMLGYLYMRRGDDFFLTRSIRRFITRNPRLFTQGQDSGRKGS